MVKKVCHITSAHGRYDVRIFEKECKSLVNAGYDVTLLVNDSKDDETIEGVKIVSTKFKPRNRMERFLLTGRRMLKMAVEINADIYHFHDPDLLPLANKLKKKKKKVIFDSHEDVPEQIIDKQWMPALVRYPVSKIYEAYERSLIKGFDGVISVTPHIVERLRRINSMTVMVTNYPLVDDKEKIVRSPGMIVCFAGGISKQWNHDRIIQAIEKIEEVRYLLAGNGSKEYMDLLRSLPGWNKVEYKGRIPHSDVKTFYEQAMAGVALNFTNQVKEEGTLGNTKLFEFMEAKLPVICTDYKLWKEIIKENDCGICVDPNDIEAIRNSIEYMKNNPDKARAMGENGRAAVLKKYNWATQEAILIGLYRKLE